MKSIEQHVAVVVILGIGRLHAVFEQDMTVQTELCSRRRRLARVIRLGCALGHHNVSARCDRLGHQKLQFAGFVTARRQTRAIVPLDPQLRPTQRFA